MTSKRDLKRRVRERQARTGERYTTALAQVTKKAPKGAIPVVEMVELAPEAARLGLKCRVLMTPGISRETGGAALEKLRDALHATQDDPATRHFRAVALAGQQPTCGEERSALDLVAEAHRFMTRARAGIGGVSAGGSMLALPVAAGGNVEMVIFLVWLAGAPMRLPVVIAGTMEQGVVAIGGMAAPVPWRREPTVVLATASDIESAFRLSLSGEEER